MNNRTFSDKVALVTGGTSGIGKTTAIEFARAGAKVVLTGRREKEGAQVVDAIKKLGGDAAFIRTDVAKDADVKKMVDFTVDKFGRGRPSLVPAVAGVPDAVGSARVTGLLLVIIIVIVCF